jgi:hypothetical protein
MAGCQQTGRPIYWAPWPTSMILSLAAPKLMGRAGWQYFTGLDSRGRPLWSSDARAMSPVITDPNGVGWTVSAIFDAPLGRYLVATEHGTSFDSQFTLLEAPSPWGPWRTVAYTKLEDPQGRVGPRSFHYNFLANSLSADGRRFTLVFAGAGDGDALNLVDGTFATAAPPPRGKHPHPAPRGEGRSLKSRGPSQYSNRDPS